MSDKTDTPETDKAHEEYLKRSWTEHPLLTTDMAPVEHARKLERERDELRDQLRAMVNAKGRHNTQIAMEKLVDLLPENAK